MELIIPPRDHRPTTYRYTWDENGEVERVERVSESVDYTSARQTLQWPFLNMTPPNTTSSKRSHARAATWEPRQASNLLYTAQSSPSTFDKSLVPDYIVNYLRGETPETVALRASLRPRPREVDVQQSDDAHRSRAANFYFSASGTSSAEEDGGPEGSAGEGEKGSRKVRGPQLTGWKGGIAINALVAFGILVVSVVCLTLAVSRSSLLEGEAPIYTGGCPRARRIHFGLQALVGVFTVALLAAANYALQVLSSPTRLEVALAHEERRWLDVGVPSVRNLRFISRSRVFMIVSVLLVSFSIHVLYNSVLFVSRMAPPSHYILVSEPFLSGAPFSNSSSSNAAGLSRNELLSLQGRASRGQLTPLSARQCLAPFASDADYTALLVATDLDAGRNSLLQTLPADAFLSTHINTDIADGITLRRSSIQSCLAEEAASPPLCDLRLSASLLGIVALLNLILVIAVGATALVRDFHPLATIGDAIASFLEVPDSTTANACLLTKKDVKEGRWPLAEATYWVPAPHYWIATPSRTRWGVFLLTWSIPAALSATGLAMAIRSHPEGRLSPFGAPASEIFTFSPDAHRAAATLLASLPHLLAALLYLTLNALLSTYFVAAEFSSFAIPDAPRPLRLSSRARGSQVTSLYITLPRPYSWLLWWP
ncbi:hypothetical protein VUR80DRAFT_8586 [Thermomyces stellatus]